MLPDIDYEQLNPGVRQLVRTLRELGFNTCDSGDGRTHEFECDRDVAYVSMLVQPTSLVSRAIDLRAAMEQRGVPIQAQAHGVAFIQATFDPVDGFAILDLVGVTDDMLGEVER